MSPLKWYEDRDETVAFARYFWQGTFNAIGTTGEILDYFEEPWLFDKDYKDYKEDKERARMQRQEDYLIARVNQR